MIMDGGRIQELRFDVAQSDVALADAFPKYFFST